MEPEVAGVIRIFNSLNTKRQDEAIEALKEYFNADSQRRQRLINDSEPRRVAKRVNLGPVDGVLDGVARFELATDGTADVLGCLARVFERTVDLRTQS